MVANRGWAALRASLLLRSLERSNPGHSILDGNFQL